MVKNKTLFFSRWVFALSLFASLAWINSSCISNQTQGQLPPVMGEVNGLTIVTDTVLWNHGISKKIVPLLQKNNREYEIFDISAIPPQAVNDIFKRSYNMLFIIVLDNNATMGQMMKSRISPHILKEVRETRKEWLIPIKNLFASGQRVVYIVVDSEEELDKRLSEEGDRLLRYFDSHLQKGVLDRLKKVGLATGLFDNMSREGYHLDLPKTFTLAMDSAHFQWFRKIAGPRYDENIIVYHIPYENKEVFTKQGLLAFKDKMSKIFLADPEDKDLYITTQEIYPMEIHRRPHTQEYVVETEGLWKTSNSTRGGPYYGQAMLNSAKNEFYYVEYWLYSPEYSKDRPLRNLRAIMESFKFVTSPNN